MAGEVYVGTPQQSMMVYFNTGDSETTLISSRCTDCERDVFEIDDSSSFVISDPAEDQYWIYYENFSIGGSIYGTDQFCPVSDTNSCADNFKFGVA